MNSLHFHLLFPSFLKLTFIFLLAQKSHIKLTSLLVKVHWFIKTNSSEWFGCDYTPKLLKNTKSIFHFKNLTQGGPPDGACVGRSCTQGVKLLFPVIIAPRLLWSQHDFNNESHTQQITSPAVNSSLQGSAVTLRRSLPRLWERLHTQARLKPASPWAQHVCYHCTTAPAYKHILDKKLLAFD